MVSEAIFELSLESVERIEDYAADYDAVGRTEIGVSTTFHRYQTEISRLAEEAEIGYPDADVKDAEYSECFNDSTEVGKVTVGLETKMFDDVFWVEFRNDPLNDVKEMRYLVEVHSILVILWNASLQWNLYELCVGHIQFLGTDPYLLPDEDYQHYYGNVDNEQQIEAAGLDEVLASLIGHASLKDYYI